MTIFNSQRLNNDPEPWLGPRGRAGINYGLGVQRFEPRPEYDNKPNRVLVKLREVLLGTREYAVEAAAEDMLEWLTEQHERYFLRTWTDAEVFHAQKVLTRLVNVYGTD